MNQDQYTGLYEIEKNKKDGTVKIGTGISLKKTNKKKIHERILIRIRKKNYKVKSAGVYVIIEFIKDQVVESSIDDPDVKVGDEQDKIIGFR